MRALLPLFLALLALPAAAQTLIVTNGHTYIEFASPIVVTNTITRVELVGRPQGPAPADTNQNWTVRLEYAEHAGYDGPEGELDVNGKVFVVINVSQQDRVDYLKAQGMVGLTKANYLELVSGDKINESVQAVALLKFQNMFANRTIRRKTGVK